MQTYHRNLNLGFYSYSAIAAHKAAKALDLFDRYGEEVVETEWDAFLPVSDRERKRFLLKRTNGKFLKFLKRSGLRAYPGKL